MNELVTINEKGNSVTTSLIIAEIFEKEHNKVVRDIENLSCSVEFNAANFGVISYTDSMNRDQRAEQKYLALNLSQRLTREQLSRMYQVSKDTIDRLSEEELKNLGFVKLKIGTSVRFERISMAKASREIFRLIRKGQ